MEEKDDKESSSPYTSRAEDDAEKLLLERFQQIPPALRIRILHQDEDIVVVHKPPNLRSVPGHATPRNDDDNASTLPAPKRTAQQAWVQAIEFLATSTTTSSINDPHAIYFQRLGENPGRVASIPRRLGPFTRYLQRSAKRILQEEGDSDLPSLAKTLLDRIQKVQQRFQNAPTPTSDEESVLGQLRLLGFASLHAVHRLDCATSGVLLVARHPAAASFLSAAWRERRTTKVYHAVVPEWPSCSDATATSTTQPPQQGCINVPLMPHPTERLKWVVATEQKKDDRDAIESNPVNATKPSPTAKPCQTLWKVLSSSFSSSSSNHKKRVVLELTPITGRTHQLRVHCAHTGSPIWGDTLYGCEHDNIDDNGSKQEKYDRLYLHAYQLTVPHPTLGTNMKYTAEPEWTI